jgi:signal transduction histidine kinase
VKSISIKVTVWSVAALLISLAVFIVVANNVSNRSTREDFAQFSRVFFQEAVSAYQTGGASQLSLFLAKLNRPGGAEFHLTDGRGRDLATGEDRSETVRGTMEDRHGFFRSHGGFTIGVPSKDGRYVWLLSGTPPSLALLAPFYVLLLATVAVLYWLVTANIARPLRHLASVVDRFGHGELTARAKTRSVDEVGNLGRSFNTMAERIQTLLTTERQLLQDVSHELRSPLARLTFEAEMVRKTTDRDAAATRLRHDIERLSELVSTLIDMARVEGEAGTVEMEEVDLNDLLLSIAEDCDVEAADRGCTISMTLPDVVNVCGNVELLRRAIENVIRNAIRYAPSGTAVEVGMQRESDTVVISVRDRGPGIPNDLTDKIFDPFFRVDTSREEKTGGFGLGLAIARRAIRVHQGDITAQNANPGALLRMTLPTTAAMTATTIAGKPSKSD